MKKYAKTHEWLSLDGNVATLGISNHAQEQLGDVVYVDLPEVGKELKKGDIFCAIESVKAASDVYSPVSGKIVDINSNLDQAPETVNTSAEEEGWIVKLEINDENETNGLMNEEEYNKFLETEAN